MPGRRSRKFWEHDRGELLAAHILSSIAATSPVPRPMDFGIDLVCTLTQVRGDSLIAEENFCVQVKSSLAPVIYGGMKKGKWQKDSIEWLLSQDLPLFLCVADVPEASVSLYSTIWARWFTSRSPLPARLELVPGKANEDFKGKTIDNRYPSRALGGGRRPGDGRSWKVPLGKPILTISITEAEDALRRENARSVLKRWIGLERRNVAEQISGVPYVEEFPSWETNLVPGPEVKVWFRTGNFVSGTEQALVARASALFHGALANSDRAAVSAVVPLLLHLDSKGLLDNETSKSVKSYRAPTSSN